MMDIWVELKLNQFSSIQYLINSGVGSYKSVLCRVLTHGMSLVIENITPNVIDNSCKSILTQFVPAKVDIGTGIIKVYC